MILWMSVDGFVEEPNIVGPPGLRPVNVEFQPHLVAYLEHVPPGDDEKPLLSAIVFAGGQRVLTRYPVAQIKAALAQLGQKAATRSSLLNGGKNGHGG